MCAKSNVNRLNLPRKAFHKMVCRGRKGRRLTKMLKANVRPACGRMNDADPLEWFGTINAQQIKSSGEMCEKQ
jgi:hypothetical protein